MSPEAVVAYFVKAFNAGDLEGLLKVYGDKSQIVTEPGKTVQGLDNVRQALNGYLGLKLPIKITNRRLYKAGDIALSIDDWSIEGKGPDGKDFQLGGTSADLLAKQPGGNWIYLLDNAPGTD